MPPSEDSSPATRGRTRGDAVLGFMIWMMWIRDAAMVVAYVALLLMAVNLHFTAAWSRQKVGFLSLVSLACVVVAIPGALMVPGSPWAAAMLQAQEQRFNHPRLFGLAQVWLGVFVSGWLCAMVLLFPYYSPVPVTYLVFLVGFGPMLAILLFDRRH